MNEIHPVAYPSLDRRGIVGLNDLEAARKIGSHPAAEGFQSVGRKTAALVEPLIGFRRRTRSKMLDHDK